MDGKNVDSVLMEFGVRFHRLIYEHLQQYSYSCMGGMLAICDVAEYRKCAKEFKVSIGYYCKCSLSYGSCVLNWLAWVRCGLNVCKMSTVKWPISQVCCVPEPDDKKYCIKICVNNC